MLSTGIKVIIWLHALLLIAGSVVCLILPWSGSSWSIDTSNGELTRFLYKEYYVVNTENETLSETMSLKSLRDQRCNVLSTYECTLYNKILDVSYAVIVFVGLSVVLAVASAFMLFCRAVNDDVHRILLTICTGLSCIALIIYPIGIPPIDSYAPRPLVYIDSFWVWLVMTLITIWASTTVMIKPKKMR